MGAATNVAIDKTTQSTSHLSTFIKPIYFWKNADDATRQIYFENADKTEDPSCKPFLTSKKDGLAASVRAG